MELSWTNKQTNKKTQKPSLDYVIKISYQQMGLLVSQTHYLT